MRIIISLVAITYLLIACSEKQRHANCSNLISIPSALDNTIMSFDEFIDSSWLVALKTPQTSLQSSLTKVLCYDDMIYTFDELQTKTINVYNGKGEFLFTVFRLGKGPTELIGVSNFSMYEGEIYVTNPLQKQTLIFSAKTGKYIKTLDYPFAALECNKLSSNRYLFVISNYNDDLGDQYLTNSVLITDSLFNVLSFGMKHPKANNCQTLSRSQWNVANNNIFYSMYDETIYQYNSNKDSIGAFACFDYGNDNIPGDKLDNIDNYMNFYGEGKPRLTSESPVVVGDYVFAVFKQGKDKYLIVHNNDKTFSKKILADDYCFTYPYSIIGNANKNILISNVEYLHDTASLSKYGITYTDSISNVLLFSRLK